MLVRKNQIEIIWEIKITLTMMKMMMTITIIDQIEEVLIKTREMEDQIDLMKKILMKIMMAYIIKDLEEEEKT